MSKFHAVMACFVGLCLPCGIALAAADLPMKKVDWRPLEKTIPDVSVIDQYGRTVKFYGELVKGRKVAINFIFTGCSSICTPQTAIFRELQKRSRDKDLTLISVSVDPLNDRPEVLRRYAEKFNAESGWTFVTGAPQNIEALLKSLGVFAADRNEHAPTVLIGDENTVRWTRAYGLTPAQQLYDIVSQLYDYKHNFNGSNDRQYESSLPSVTSR